MVNLITHDKAFQSLQELISLNNKLKNRAERIILELYIKQQSKDIPTYKVSYRDAVKALDDIANSINKSLAIFPGINIGSKESWQTLRDLVSSIKDRI